jgi:hypothetical protein
MAVGGYLFVLGCFATPSAATRLLGLWLLGAGALAVNAWGIRRRTLLLNSPARSQRVAGWSAIGLTGMALFIVGLPTPANQTRQAAAVNASSRAGDRALADEADVVSADIVASESGAVATAAREVDARTQALELLDAAIAYRDVQRLGLALAALEQAVALAPDLTAAVELQQQVAPQATLQVADRLTRQADLEVEAEGADTEEVPSAEGAPCRVRLEIANPWCYNFVRGYRITSPVAEFCQYFKCVAAFWSGQGYVVQCRDGTFSKTGGTPRPCLGHGGSGRILRST